MITLLNDRHRSKIGNVCHAACLPFSFKFLKDLNVVKDWKIEDGTKLRRDRYDNIKLVWSQYACLIK